MREILRRHSDRLTSAAIFVLTLLVFLKSPVHQLADSRYAMVLTDSLTRHAAWDLQRYFRPPFDPRQYPYLGDNGYPLNLQVWRGHVYYGYPIGTSILSIPFVIVLRLFSVSAFDAHGSYTALGEEQTQAIIAAMLMAGLATLWYLTARLLLPPVASAAIATGAALGTQVWSTASRALWSHTWLIFLLGLAIWALVKAEVEASRVRPVLLATVLSWMYFVRPTASIAIICITLYLLAGRRRLLPAYALAGLAWLALFVSYSLHLYGELVPPFYAVGFYLRDHASFWKGVSGVLSSPSRGLLSCVPITLFAVYLAIRYRRTLRPRSLAWLASGAIALQIGLIGSYRIWDGATCFGPRYLTDVVPWLVLLVILGVRAWLNAARGPRKAELITAVVLLGLSVFINGRGATSDAVWRWNAYLAGDPEERRPRIMDWRYPQWLAGLIPPPVPSHFPRYMPGTTLELGQDGSDHFTREGFGWGEPEGSFRWTDGTSAHLVFGMAPLERGILEVLLEPFLVPRTVDHQRVRITLNGTTLGSLHLRDPEARAHSLPIPPGMLKEDNLLVLDLPDAASPRSLKMSHDSRKLGVKLYWLRISPSSGPGRY